MNTTIYLGICVLCSSALKAQDLVSNSDKALILEASYTGDNVYNLSGGIKTGYGYLGMANLHFGFDFEIAGLWRGGFFYINAANTHGTTPSADMLGDVQVASNIEAGNHTYLQELWYRQTIGNVDLTVGIQDLNTEFANSEYGGLFLNSSFGILPVISGNIPAPIFPLTSLGFTAKWNITDKTSWIGALYDGNPTDFDHNPYNMKWQLVSGDGILAVSEIQHHINGNTLPGTYKLGIYSRNHLIERIYRDDLPDSLNDCKLGVYMYADKKLWKHALKSLDVFVQAGYSPTRTSLSKVYLGFGMNLTGFLSRSDVLGFAIAYVNLTRRLGSETTVELTWKKQLGENIFVQPDLQYIIHPSGNRSNIGNCLAGILRVGLSF